MAECGRSSGKAEGGGWSGLLSRSDKAAGRPAAPALHHAAVADREEFQVQEIQSSND